MQNKNFGVGYNHTPESQSHRKDTFTSQHINHNNTRVGSIEVTTNGNVRVTNTNGKIVF